MSANTPIPNYLEALLVDEAWLKRLAAGLVGESGADDLAQDVLVAAIKTPPRESGAQLRAWAKTVAQRLAIRRGGRDRSREVAEQGAARPESFDQDSEQRLRLHQRLNEAILSLDAPQRTLLVMRYLDELTPAEIATRLGLPPATARKRLSRALVKLREVLDGEFGERAQWMHALGPMAFGAGWQDMLPAAKATTALAPSSVAALAPILALMTMKKLIVGSIALCVALLVGVPALQEWLRGPLTIRQGNELTYMRDFAESTREELVQADTAKVRGSAQPIAQVSAASNRPQIILVDSQGQPITDGVGAWVDLAKRVHILEFDNAGHADLPAAALGSMCLVRAPGLAIEGFLVDAVDKDVAVELGAFTTLRGRLLVDGIPPVHSLQIDCTWYLKPNTRIQFKDEGPMDQDQGAILNELGLTGGVSSTRTLPGGGFAFEGVQPLAMGHVELPKYLKVLPSGQWSQATFQSTDSDILIEAQSLPYVHGYLVWADDGTPYTAATNVGFTNRREQENLFTTLKQTDTGEFFIPLKYLTSDRKQGLEFASIRLEVAGGAAGGGQDFRFSVDAETMVMEVGTLRVNRKSLTQIQVVDANDEPVSGVYVASTAARVRTDSRGRVELTVPAGEVVLALGYGHGLGVLDLSLESADAGGSYVIRLPEGNDLTISCGLPEVETVGKAITLLQVEFPNELLGAKDLQGRSLLNFYQSALKDTLGVSLYSWGMRIGFAGNSGPVVLPGLAGGTLIRVAMVDAKGNELVREQIRIPHGRVPSKLELIPNPGAYGTIAFEVVNDRGVPLQEPYVEGLGGDWLMRYIHGQKGPVVVTPLAIGSYRFKVGARGRVPAYVNVELGAGVQSERVVLYPGREVVLRFQDAAGVPLTPESVTLLDEAGEPAGETLKPKNGKLRLGFIPREGQRLLILMGTRYSHHSVPAGGLAPTIVLAATGKLRAHFDQIPRISSDRGSMSLSIRGLAEGDSEPLERTETFNRGAEGAWDLSAALHPGHYKVRVLVNKDEIATNSTAVTRTLFDGQVTIVAGEEALITISAGANPTVTLTPR